MADIALMNWDLRHRQRRICIADSRGIWLINTSDTIATTVKTDRVFTRAFGLFASGFQMLV
jgi:hypothetical protein